MQQHVNWDMKDDYKEEYTDLYNNGGADATAAMHCYFDASHSSVDNTHLSAYGAELIAGMIAEETDRLTLKIAENLKWFSFGDFLYNQIQSGMMPGCIFWAGFCNKHDINGHCNCIVNLL